MKKESTYGLSPERLARLLAMGMQGGGAPHGSGHRLNLAGLLEDVLCRELPRDPTSPNSLPALLNWSRQNELSGAGPTIGELLFDSKTDLAVLRALKDCGKGLVRCDGPKGHEEIGDAVFYAAIASALIFHDHKITKLSYAKLHEAYTKLEQRPWILRELKEIFRRARALCDERKRKLE